MISEPSFLYRPFYARSRDRGPGGAPASGRDGLGRVSPKPARALQEGPQAFCEMRAIV